MVTVRRWDRTGRIHWAIIAFLGGFVVLMLGLLVWFIVPGMQVLGDSDAPQGNRAGLSAVASLLLAVLLVTLFVGLLLTFRVRRFFFGDPQPRQRTGYADAWAESGRRLKTHDDPDDD